MRVFIATEAIIFMFATVAALIGYAAGLSGAFTAWGFMLLLGHGMAVLIFGIIKLTDWATEKP